MSNAKAKQQGALSRLFDIIGGIFKPILTVIIGAGVLQALRDILLLTGVISRVSSSYIFLDALGSAAFYFLPIFLAFSSAQIFGATPYLATAVAAFLLYPNVVNLFEWANSVGWDLTLFGVIPVTYAKYPSSVLPIILIVFFQSKIEPLIKRIIPDLLKSIFVPVLTLFITCIVGLIVIGPIGTWLGDGLAAIIGWLGSKASWLVPTIVGAASPFLVMTGSHYALFPVATQNLAQLGYDTVLMPGNMASNIALAGASFAVASRSKQPKYKSYCVSSGITALFGISQSSLYGIAIPLKRPLIAAVIGGGVAGFYAGITNIHATSFMTPGLLSLVGYLNTSANLINSLITVAIAFVVTFILTLVFHFDEPSPEAVEELSGESVSPTKADEIAEEAQQKQEESQKLAKEAGEASFDLMRAETTIGADAIGTATGLVEKDKELVASRAERYAAEIEAQALEARRIADEARKDADAANGARDPAETAEDDADESED